MPGCLRDYNCAGDASPAPGTGDCRRKNQVYALYVSERSSYRGKQLDKIKRKIKKEMENISEKGIICVTGGTGYVASWLIMRLLQSGYYVNTTINNNMDQEGASFLKKLPNATQKLKIFTTNPQDPESFLPAIEGCNGVIIGHSVDFEDEYNDEEIRIQRSITAILGILKACLDSKTIKRVIYTSSDAALCFNEENPDIVDENWWSDINFIKKLQPSGVFYCISKTLIEKEALNFAQKNGLDLVCINHAWVFGPFVTPQCPLLVRRHMPMILEVL